MADDETIDDGDGDGDGDGDAAVGGGVDDTRSGGDSIFN